MAIRMGGLWRKLDFLNDDEKNVLFMLKKSNMIQHKVVIHPADSE